MAKIGGFEIDTKISATGVLALTMAFVAMVGGWYKFDYRISNLETQNAQLQEDHQEEMSMHEKLNATLNDLNYTVGQLEQRLDDAHVGQNTRGRGN